MTKILKNVVLNVRLLNQKQLGCSIPLELVNEIGIREGDRLFIPELHLEENIQEFRCRTCNLLFSQNEEHNFCPSCGEENIIELKGGND